MAQKPSSAERLFGLVLALIASSGGLTKSQILSSVTGYAHRFVDAAARSSLDRQFERDKEQLRGLGIPVETVVDPEWPEDTQLLRYRIPKDVYRLPDEFRFTPKELALLGLASAVWREGSLSAEARRSLMKLTSHGVRIDDSLLGVSPRVHTRDPAFAHCSAAAQQVRSASFAYASPRGHREVRTVVCLAVVQHEARWHLYGFDVDRGSFRTFLLSRVVSAVRVHAPADGHLRAVIETAAKRADGESWSERCLSELHALAAKQVAVIEVAESSDAWVAFSAGKAASAAGDTPGWCRLSVSYLDPAVFAAELAGYADQVRVLEPRWLREQVCAQLRSVVLRHG